MFRFLVDEDLPRSLAPNEASPETIIAAVLDAIQGVDETEIQGGLMIIEPGRVRFRRAR